MKKILLSFLALGGLLFASSCQMDEPDAGTLTGEVDFTITAGIPSGITTYSPTDVKAFSHLGGINNVSGDYVLRFILEVYDGNAVAYEETQYLEDFSNPNVTFNPRLLAKKYNFVFWADFVAKPSEKSTPTDLYYSTANLSSIEYTKTVKDNPTVLTTDLVDAYTAHQQIDLSVSSQNVNVTLTRPFGKIRLLATDAPQNIENQNSNIPVSATIAFTDATVPTTFNARTGETSEPTLSVTEYNFTAVKELSPVVTGHSDLAQEGKFAYLLGQTYFFESPVSTAYKMTVTVNNATEQIGYRELTNIPVSTNKLTTVIGNFYTNEGNLEVIVEDKFGNDEEVISADKWDGTTTTPDIDEQNQKISISSPAQLAGFVELVNGGNTYEGYTVTLHSSLDLNGKEWTPIATGARSGSSPSENSFKFKGTFNGNGNTIYNLSIKDDPENADQAIGLFGIVDGGKVMNLKFENVDINVPSSEMAAAAVGMLTGDGTVSGIEVVSGKIIAERGNGAVVGRMTKSGTIEDCINRAAVSGTGANVGGIVGAAYYTEEGGTMTIDDCHNYGTVSGTEGVVGGIVGLSAANVSNCTNEAAITGNGADVAGIVAEQQNAGSITGCVNKGAITNNAQAYGTGGIVGWIRYNGNPSAYPAKNVIEVIGNINHGSVTGGNDAGGIVGTAYNLGVIKENYNYAPALSAKTFAAGIVGNTQFTETAIGMTETDMVYVTGNFTTTPLDKITVEGSCKDLFVYINNQSKVTEENNTLLINDPEQFSSFATAVNNGNTFSGINVALGSDIDLNNQPWTPIGTSTNAFKGTFNGNGHTINNLEISGLDKSIIAGLFGELNGTVKDLVIDNAKISHVSDGSGGIGVVAGSIFNTGLIENVTVSNAEITGNRWTGGIVGYMYGSVENCKVSNIELTVTPDNLSGNYDNGDKVGGIVGLSPNDNRGTISGNHAENVTIKGYRDLGGIAGAANASALTGNTASNITITVDQVTGWYSDETANAGIILGRKLDNSTLDGSNTESGENSISNSYLISAGSSWINASGMISFTPESNSTYFVEPGEYAGIQVFTNGKTNVSLIAQGEVTINGKATFGSHSNRDRHIPENNTIEGFTVKGELFINACGAAVAKNNRAAQLTVKTLGLTDDPSYSSDISLSGNTIDGTLGTAPQEYGIYIVPNVTDYKLTVEDNTIQNVKSHGFTIQGGGDGSAKTTIGEYSIKNNNFASWGLGRKDNRGAIKVWADTEIAPSDMSTSSVTALSEKAKEFVTHILNGGNTFGSQLENCCIFEFYGLAFDSLE